MRFITFVSWLLSALHGVQPDEQPQSTSSNIESRSVETQSSAFTRCNAVTGDSLGDPDASVRMLKYARHLRDVADSAFRLYFNIYEQRWGEADVHPGAFYAGPIELGLHAVALDRTNASAWMDLAELQRLRAYAEGLTLENLTRSQTYAECAAHFAADNVYSHIRRRALEFLEDLEIELGYVRE